MIFETTRLCVREFTYGDEEQFFRINGDQTVMMYIREALTRVESDHFMNENIRFYRQHPGLGRWCVTEKDGNNFIGTFALIYLPFEEEKDKVQIGYALVQSAWRKGYATELTNAGVDYYFKHHAYQELHAITSMQNIASQKVLLKCGFVENGTKQKEAELIQRYILYRRN
jgi:ribosomal-protein-alanine N-acetyltransferase